MKLVELFFQDLDTRWRGPCESKLRLDVIGASALDFQADLERGTKDSDILETTEMSAEIQKRLLDLGGKGAPLHKKYRIYLDIVKRAIPFLPQVPVFHPVPALASLAHFAVRVLDPTDIVVSKLKRFSPNDINDIRFIVTTGLALHKNILERFHSALDYHSTDARADDFPKYIENLNTVERDMLLVPESEITLPHWI